MPVSYLTYVYLILFISSFLCTLLATFMLILNYLIGKLEAFQRNEAHLEIFAITTPLFFIGFCCERFAIQHV